MKLKPTLGTTCSMTMARHSRVVGAARLLALLLLLTLPAVVQAQFNYTTDNGTITITGYTGPGGAVTIPSTINGLPVTRIGNYAFEYNTSLTSVTIPNSATSIGNAAFYGCNLTSVTIGNSVTSIGYPAFYGCTGLTSITIPDSVISIGDGAFADCTSLTAITVDALNSAYSSVDGVLFNTNLTTLIQYPGSKAGSYTIPNSVTSIGGAFYYCTSLTSITIPDSVTSIGNQTFEACTSLTSVTIPNTVTNIGYEAFYGCTSLTNVTIPNSVTSIGDGAFNYCTSLTSVTIGHSVTSIGVAAFANCSSLAGVTIPNSVTGIGDWAFANCSSLTAITVDALNSVYRSVEGVLFNKSQATLIQYPGGKTGSYMILNSVTNVGVAAFAGCTSLTGFTIPNSVTSIKYGTFSGCTSLASITIPDSVTSIEGLHLFHGFGAFAYCTSLTSLTIGNSVTSIGYGTFYGCTNLTGVYFKGNAPSLGSSVFEGDNLAVVYYLPGTTGWGSTFGDRPTALWVLPNPLILNNGPSFGVQTDGFGFIISWATNLSVVVEASPDLSNPVWTPVSTNTLTGGSSYFSDPQWTNHPTRFYRLRAP